MKIVHRNLETITHDEVTCLRGTMRNRFLGTVLNCYYRIDDCLIDTGASNLAPWSSEYLRHAGLNQAVLTHVHEDHAGMAPWIKENLGIPVRLHRGDHEEAARSTDLYLYRRASWGNRKSFTADDLPPVVETGRFRLEVIHTPGHSPNHVVFLEKTRGWLFTGDLYIGPKQNVSFLEENTLDAIASIKRLLEHDWDTIFCAHSGIQKDGKEKFRRKLGFFEDICGTVKKLHDQGIPMTEINKRLFPRKDLWERISHGEWTSCRIVSTCLRDN